MRYLTLGEVVELHRGVLQAGGALGIRDLGALDSAAVKQRLCKWRTGVSVPFTKINRLK